MRQNFICWLIKSTVICYKTRRWWGAIHLRADAFYVFYILFTLVKTGIHIVDVVFCAL